MRTILLIPVLLLAAAASAQTNRIEHRSHSGAGIRALKTDNFGVIAPRHRIENPKLRAADTAKVIHVKPWKAVQDSLQPKVKPLQPVKNNLPPMVNPIYTRTKTPAHKPVARSK